MDNNLNFKKEIDELIIDEIKIDDKFKKICKRLPNKVIIFRDKLRNLHAKDEYDNMIFLPKDGISYYMDELFSIEVVNKQVVLVINYPWVSIYYNLDWEKVYPKNFIQKIQDLIKDKSRELLDIFTAR